jgi:hypothetical protein
MYNSDTPTRAELPSSKQLIRSTVIAAISAVVLLVAVVLPAEYGIDPTGVGRVLRLTEMGEIKTKLAAEAAAEEAQAKPSMVLNATETTLPAPAPVAVAPKAEPSQVASDTANRQKWRDEMTFTLKPDEGIEVKMKMNNGDKATFAWAVQGGVVNYDTHGDSVGQAISYEKGRAVSSNEGELVAAFTGNHGWFWRNRGKADVTLVLRTGGAYAKIDRVK